MNKLENLKVVQKPWGLELWFALVPNAYLGKVIIVYPGERTSFHYHRYKEETLYVAEGTLVYHVEEDGEKRGKIFFSGEFVHVPPETKHSLGASRDGKVILFEVSTCYPEDSIRVEDRYGRKVIEMKEQEW